ncbi:hypothetical protein IAI18_22590 [Acetobacteraceae bacterium H6797]|nr:hypothetical protein [Acetobacteraceae bacterium H6797]
MTAPPTLGADLERVVRRVVDDYAAFVERGPGPGMHDDAKAFAAHHAACKSALAHLEHLMKLMRAAVGSAEADNRQLTAEMLAEARDAISATQDEEENDEDAGNSG